MMLNVLNKTRPTEEKSQGAIPLCERKSKQTYSMALELGYWSPLGSR